MTVSTTAAYVVYAGAGATGPFAIPFKFLANTDIVAVKIAADGSETTLTGNTITGAGAPTGGSLTTGAPVAVGETLRIFRSTGLTQTAAYTANGPFPASTHEQALDKAMLAIQDVSRDAGRALLAPLGEGGLEIPAADERAGLLLGFDDDGKPTVGVDAGALGALANLSNVPSASFGAKLFQGTSLYAFRSGADRVRDFPSLLEFYSSPSSTVADAMQAAINWMETSKIPVRLPAGQIVLNKNLQIKSHTHFVGAGRDSSTVFLPANIDMTGAPSYGGDQRAVWNNPSISNVIFEGFSFQGPGAGNTKIVNVALRNVTNFLARDCGWKDIGDVTWYATGVVLFESTGVVFDSCLFDNCKGDGGAVSSASRDVLVKNCRITNNRDWGFALSIDVDNAVFEGNYVANNLSTGIGADRCENVAFIGNRCFNNEHGIRIAKFAIPGDTQRQIIVQGNICGGNLQGITVEGSDAPCVTVIEGNTVIGTTNEAILLADVQGAIVCGNSLYNNSADNIAIRGYTLPCGGHVIDDNKIVGGTRGIYEAASGAGSILQSKIGHSNSIEGIATANTYALTASVDQQGEPLTRSFGGFRGFEALRAVYQSGAIVNRVEVYGSTTGNPVEMRAVGADATTNFRFGVAGLGGSLILRTDIFGTPVDSIRLDATGVLVRRSGGGLEKVIGPREVGWTASTGIASKGAYATYSAGTASATYTQAELQAVMTALQGVSQRLKAMEDMARTHGLIN